MDIFKYNRDLSLNAMREIDSNIQEIEESRFLRKQKRKALREQRRRERARGRQNPS